jgi:hypothetical protein
VSQANHYAHDCDAEGASPGSGVALCRDPAGFPVTRDPLEVGAVASPFQFRILLHEGGDGKVRLLKDVIQMWKDGVNGEPGRYVLLTDDTLIPRFKGVSLRDGEVVGKRISTVAYDFQGETLAMDGTMGSVLTAEIALAPGAPTNPFRHRYHPDHDNLGPDYKTPKPEAYAVTRHLHLSFGGAGGTGLGDGFSSVAGTYREQVTGLHKNPIVSAGTFVLRHVSSIEELNDGAN